MIQDHSSHESISREAIQQKIEQYGCYVVLIEPDDYLPGFAYTIGLYQKFNHPEIICFGLKLELLGALLNDACDLIKKGQSLKTVTQYEDFLNDYTTQFLSVDKEFYPNYWGYANWFYGSHDYPALQLVWPDRQHLFPWEIGFNADLKFKQPLLDRNTDFKFHEERNLGVYTTQQVLDGEPILYVYHDDDGDWQFHSENESSLGNAVLVCLEEITRRDPSVNEIYHLSYGSRAWRTSIEDKWQWEHYQAEK